MKLSLTTWTVTILLLVAIILAQDHDFIEDTYTYVLSLKTFLNAPPHIVKYFPDTERENITKAIEKFGSSEVKVTAGKLLLFLPTEYRKKIEGEPMHIIVIKLLTLEEHLLNSLNPVDLQVLTETFRTFMNTPEMKAVRQFADIFEYEWGFDTKAVEDEDF